MKVISKVATTCQRALFSWLNSAEWEIREWLRKRRTTMRITFSRDLARQAGMEENATIYEFDRVEHEVSFGRQDRSHLNWLKGLKPVVRIPGLSGIIGDLGNRDSVVIESNETYKQVTRCLNYYNIPWAEKPAE